MLTPASLLFVSLCCVLCVTAQTPDQPTQTQTTVLPNGQTIIINTFLNNTNTNANANSNQNSNAKPNTNVNTNTNTNSNANSKNNSNNRISYTNGNTSGGSYSPYYSGGARNRCNLVQNTNYKGDLIRTVTTATAADCCGICFAQNNCSVFVFCARTSGCRNANINVFPYQSCSLKSLPGIASGGAIESWASGQGVEFISGSVN